MRLDQVMSGPPVTVRPDDTVKHAAQVMAARGFTLLPVIGPEDEVVGVVSEGELVQHRFPRDARDFLPASEDPGAADPFAEEATTPVSRVMITEVIAAQIHEPVPEVIERMRAAGVRAVPVFDADKLVGVVTYRDLVRVLARSDELITADVRRRLGLYSRRDRFEVQVRDGEVQLIDVSDRPAEWYTVRRLAEQVPGVVRARVTRRATGSRGEIRRPSRGLRPRA